MKRFVNECVDCGLPCMGKSCPNRNVARLYCDHCHKDVPELFRLDDEEVCEDCLLENAEAVTCENCGDADVLFDHEGTMLCARCLREATRIE